MKWIIAALIAFVMGKGLAAVYDLSHEPVHAEHSIPASHSPEQVHEIDKLIEETPVIYPTIPLVSRIARAESGGNPEAKNASSTASGLYGVITPVWRSGVKKWGKELGIHIRDRNKPWAQKRLVEKLAADNGRILQKKLGRKPSDADLYIAHFLGAHNGATLLQANQDRPSLKAVNLYSQSVVDSNRSIFFDGQKARTVRQVCQLLNDKIA